MANFTEKHLNQLKELVFEAVSKNWVIVSKLGQNFRVTNLFTDCTLNTLRGLKKQLQLSIQNLPDDEWTEKSTVAQDQQDWLNDCLNLVNLILGYRINQAEKAEIERQKTELQSKIDALEESEKTPKQKIKELKEQLNNL